MSYEFNYQLLDSLTDQYGLSYEEIDSIPPAVKGMRGLDYEPDLDDYEYIQSIY